MDSQPSSPTTPDQASTGGNLFISWLFVGAPLLWGVSQTFLKALALFK